MPIALRCIGQFSYVHRTILLGASGNSLRYIEWFSSEIYTRVTGKINLRNSFNFLDTVDILKFTYDDVQIIRIVHPKFDIPLEDTFPRSN